jgi:hypothetical protein
VCKYYQLLIESPSTAPNLFVVGRTSAPCPQAREPVGSRKVPVDLELVVLADAIRARRRSARASNGQLPATCLAAAASSEFVPVVRSPARAEIGEAHFGAGESAGRPASRRTRRRLRSSGRQTQKQPAVRAPEFAHPQAVSHEVLIDSRPGLAPSASSDPALDQLNSCPGVKAPLGGHVNRCVPEVQGCGTPDDLRRR